MVFGYIGDFLVFCGNAVFLVKNFITTVFGEYAGSLIVSLCLFIVVLAIIRGVRS